MKSLVLLLSLLALSTTAFAKPPLETRVTRLEAATAGGVLTNGKILVGNGSNRGAQVTPSGGISMTNAGVVSISNTTTDGLYAVKVAKATYDFADGDLAVGAHSLGVALPAKALIIRSWMHVDTQQSDTGTCTMAVSCEDANNIKTATDLSGSAADALIEGASTGAASAFTKSIAATCNITMTVADGGSCVPLGGKGSVYVMYVVHN